MRVEAAAKPTVNKKKVKLKLGKQTTLKVKNASRKVKWTTSNKRVVQIASKKGSRKQNAVIRGMQKGKATVTAKIGSLKLRVKVTVTHTHSYIFPATCTEAAKCECGATYGEPLKHQMAAATCMKPATCERCGYTEGAPAAHLYLGGSCIWCHDLDLTSVISFTLRNTSAQGSHNVRYITVNITNNGNSEFIIQGAGTLTPSAGAAPVTLYITDADDATYSRARCFSRSTLTFFYDTMDSNNRFTFLPGGTLSFTAMYGSDTYQISMDMYGEYTFVKR